MEKKSCNGRISEDGIELKYHLKGEIINLIKEGSNSELFKIPTKTIKTMIEKCLKKEFSEVSFPSQLAQYSFYVDFEAGFYVNEGNLESYGEDADGNRGVSGVSYDDVTEHELDIEKIEIRLVDENGEVLGGEDNFIDGATLLIDKNDPFIHYVVNTINNDLSKYID